MNSTERTYLANADSSLLYIWFFDVVWNIQILRPAPDAPLYFSQKPDSSIHYVPVVFITNETMQRIATGQINELATHILEKIKANQQVPIKSLPHVLVLWQQKANRTSFMSI